MSCSWNERNASNTARSPVVPASMRALDVVGEHRVLRHLDRGLDDLAARAVGAAGTLLQLGGGGGHGGLHGGLLGGGVAAVLLLGGLGERLRHGEHRADGDAAAHSDSVQLHR